MQILRVSFPAYTFLVAFLGTGAFLKREAGDEEEEGCEEDPADDAAVESGVGAGAGGYGSVGGGGYGYDEDGCACNQLSSGNCDREEEDLPTWIIISPK